MVLETARWPGLLSLIMSAICLIPQLYLHIEIIKKNRQRCHMKSVIAMHIATIFNTMYVAWTIALSLYSVSSTPDTFSVTICGFYFFGGVWLLFAKVSIYLFYIIRLYDILDKTAYRYDPKLLFWLCIVLLILWCGSCGPSTYLAFEATIGIHSKPSEEWSHIQEFSHCADPLGDDSTITYITIVAVVCVEIFSSILVLRMYLSRLMTLSIAYNEMNLVMEQKEDATQKSSKQQNGNDLTLSANSPASGDGVLRSPSPSPPNHNSHRHVRSRTWAQKRKTNARFFQLGLRTTNTVILAVVSTSIITLFNGMGQWWNTMDCVFNTLAIYLSFSFGDKLYAKLCCCQKLCYKWCIGCCYCCCAPQLMLDQIEREQEEKDKGTMDLTNIAKQLELKIDSNSPSPQSTNSSINTTDPKDTKTAKTDIEE